MSSASPNAPGRPFTKGNKFSRGNPLGGKIEKLRARLLKAVTNEDFDAIAKKLIDMSKGGDLGAIHEFLDRVIGKARQPVDLSNDGTIRTVADGEALADQILDRLRARLGADAAAPGRN